MDNSVHQQESGTQDRQSSLVGLLFLNGIINWLLGLIRLTEEEDAGIYPGRLGNE